MLKTALVKFEDSKYNYKTSVNGNLSDEEIKQYFVGMYINCAPFPDEKMKKCVECEIL